MLEADVAALGRHTIKARDQTPGAHRTQRFYGLLASIA
jgi:hypothetical protein